jgi:hypothetical protein
MELQIMVNFQDKMCRSAATTLMSSLESLQSIHFETNKLSDELLTTLSKLNLTEQKSLIDRARYFLNVDLDEKSLKRQLKELEDTREEHELEDTYLFHGAPLVLMRRLFGMHASEFSRRRNILNIRGVGSGRPPLCNEETDHLLWKLWQLYSQLDERERFLKMADQTGLDLHLIWSTLRDHIDR